MKESKFRKEWEKERGHRVLAHYEIQTEEEAIAGDEAAYEDRTRTTIDVHFELVPAVRELITKHQSQHQRITVDNSR